MEKKFSSNKEERMLDIISFSGKLIKSIKTCPILSILMSLCFLFIVSIYANAVPPKATPTPIPPPPQLFPCTQANIFSDPNVLGGNMCAQFYGLCIGAPCEGLGQIEMTGFEEYTFTIGSGDGTIGDIIEHALCRCPFINGNSIGKASCEDRKPDGAKSISTYSFQFNNEANRFLSCNENDFNEPLRFVDCYNQPCETDAEDPTMVICKCPVFPASILPDKTFLTRGGDCNQSRCTELWSAVPPDLLPFVDQAMACGIGNPEPAPRFDCP